MNQIRIVCAANQSNQGRILVGVRHWDVHMRDQLRLQNCTNIRHDIEKETQGFLDNYGNFHTRESAWKIAEAAGQIIRRCGGDTKNGGTLYSENIY